MRSLHVLILAIAGLGGGIAVFTAFDRQGASIPPSSETSFSSAAPESRWGSNYMPNLPVVDQDGNKFLFYDDLIKSKKVIVNFIYTGCSQLCPLTTSRLAILQDKLGDAVGRDFFMYSISVDPEHDDPAKLKAYAETFRAKPGWRFLTGRPEDIQEIRYKLGERSKALGDHKQELVIGNDALGNWARDSVFGDLDELATTIRSLDPEYRPLAAALEATGEAKMVEVVPGQSLFASLCSGCHSIGNGDRAGPDMKGVLARRDHAWLREFISHPDKMFAANDATALSLATKYPGVRMPNLGLSLSDADDVLSYISSMQGNGARTGDMTRDKSGDLSVVR